MQPRTPVCRFTSNRVYYRRRQLLVVFSVGVGRRWWWQPGGGQRWQWRRPVVSRCWIFAKSAWEHNETHDKRLCPADTSAFVVPASQRLRKKSAAARCAERQSPWFCACSSFLLANYSQTYFVLSTVFQWHFGCPMLGLFATSQCSSHYAYVDLSISAYL